MYHAFAAIATSDPTTLPPNVTPKYIIKNKHITRHNATSIFPRNLGPQIWEIIFNGLRLNWNLSLG
jgi:hypothetical protein